MKTLDVIEGLLGGVLLRPASGPDVFPQTPTVPQLVKVHGRPTRFNNLFK